MQKATGIFDNLDGNFLARLREISANTRPTADGKATITFKTARIEANYSPNVIKKIEAGRLIAIPNVLGVNSKITTLYMKLQTSIRCIIVCRPSIVINLELFGKSS